MAFVIGQPCIGVKDTACVDVCPVDCIHAYVDSPQLYIDPVTCIDCGACEPACPVKAIWLEDQVPDDQKKFVAINADFFKGFDKSKSAVYTKKKKEGEGESKEQKSEGVSQKEETVAKEVVWKEVEGWEKQWELRKDWVEDRTEIQKRYGRVRSVFEQADRYVIRFFLPEKTPHHPFRYKFGLPDTMPSYTLNAQLEGNVVWITGKISDPNIVKLCGHANSFPDRFYVEYPFSHPISSVSVQPQGPFVVDVVAVKAEEGSKAA